MDGVKEVQKDIKKALREGRNIHKAKPEDKLQRNNVREVWSGMRSITGYKLATGEEEGSLERANEMNEHFIRLGLAPLAQSPSAPVTTSDTQIIQPLPPFPSLSPTTPELTGTHPGLIITTDLWLRRIHLNWHEIKAMRIAAKQGKPCTDVQLTEMLDKHRQVFREGIGTLKHIKARIELEKDAKPRFHKAGLVPYALRPRVEAELQHLVDQGIVSKVDWSEWLHQ
ncbi:hypothetical protein AAFF_G00045620 [Aldrovandia affinis]|uniref:Uncharacterized protein n=1 Tax=Aldrovandia affinis TaxID=143900 RepID=A0AAD7S2I3_9TELE|nr:hypothetical protein AAFF_G00045620 [Aldrovandia affinis]